jgi:hypothetical protein
LNLKNVSQHTIRHKHENEKKVCEETLFVPIKTKGIMIFFRISTHTNTKSPEELIEHRFESYFKGTVIDQITISDIRTDR